MAGPLRVEHDVEVARWVQEALHPLDGTVASTISPRFEAYARLLHPARLDVTTDETDAWGNHRFESREITWAEAAELIGDRASRSKPYTTWLARFGEQQFAMPGGSLDEPHQGDIPLPLLTELARMLRDEHGDADVLAAVWEGSGLDTTSTGVFAWSPDGGMTAAQRKLRLAELQSAAYAAQLASVDPDVRLAMERQEVLGLPSEHGGRGHVLLRGRLVSLTDPTWVEAAGLGWQPGRWQGDGRTPNLLWPSEPHASPAWMVATDLDLDTTIVGGSARLIGRVLEHPSFEAERVLPSDSLV